MITTLIAPDAHALDEVFFNRPPGLPAVSPSSFAPVVFGLRSAAMSRPSAAPLRGRMSCCLSMLERVDEARGEEQFFIRLPARGDAARVARLACDFRISAAMAMAVRHSTGLAFHGGLLQAALVARRI